MKRLFRILAFPLAALAIAFALHYSGMFKNKPAGCEFWFTTCDFMSTRVQVHGFAGDKYAARDAQTAVFRRLEELSKIFNYYDDASVISEVNRAAGGAAVKVPAEFIRCMKSAKEYGRLSGGAMDVTIRPLLDAWKKAAEEGRTPTDEEKAAAAALVGYGRIEIDESASTVRLPAAGMKLDLGAIAKGFIVDECAAVLKGMGIESVLIEAGGDIQTFGAKPDGMPWIIAIQNPITGLENDAILSIAVSGRAVTTSGNYRRGYDAGGKHYSHIIDPRPPYMSAEQLPQVTIVASDCTSADALATAVSVLGLEDGMKLVKSIPGVEALLITIEDGRPVLHKTEGFDKLIVR